MKISRREIVKYMAKPEGVKVYGGTTYPLTSVTKTPINNELTTNCMLERYITSYFGWIQYYLDWIQDLDWYSEFEPFLGGGVYPNCRIHDYIHVMFQKCRKYPPRTLRWPYEAWSSFTDYECSCVQLTQKEHCRLAVKISLMWYHARLSRQLEIISGVLESLI